MEKQIAHYEDLCLDLPLKIFILEDRLLTAKRLRNYKGESTTQTFHQYVSIDTSNNALSIMYKNDNGYCLDEKTILEGIKNHNRRKWKK